MQAPADGQPHQQRQQRQADKVGQQAAQGDLLDQFAAHVFTLGHQNHVPILAVVQDKQAPVMTRQRNAVITAELVGQAVKRLVRLVRVRVVIAMEVGDHLRQYAGGCAGRLQQQLAVLIEHLEGQLAFIGMAFPFYRALIGLADLQGLVQGLLQGLQVTCGHGCTQHAFEQARRLGQLGIEQLFDLMAGVAVALVGDQGHRQAEQAQNQQQGTSTDRAHQALSTR